MKVHVLASGSKGNATLVQSGDTNLLIDAGISTRRIKNCLDELNIDIADLDGVLITHEHRDHISGLPTLTKKYKTPIYSRSDTFEAMFCKNDIPKECLKPIYNSLDLGKVKIETFDISHDAADPIGFSVFANDKKCTVATDLGFVTSSAKKCIDYSDVLVLESNHDVDILKNGSYPWHLKQRILSNKGHLSNVDAAWTLARMNKQNHLKVLLAHLSEENNTPKIAQKTVNAIVKEQGLDLEIDLEIKLTKPNEIVGI